MAIDASVTSEKQASTPLRGKMLRFIQENRGLICLSCGKLELVGFLSAAAGFAQATLLLIVRRATALTAEI